MRYLDADTLDQCLRALRDGRTLDDIAGRLHIDCEYLGRLLQLPVSQPADAVDADQSVDLWRADALDQVL